MFKFVLGIVVGAAFAPIWMNLYQEAKKAAINVVNYFRR